MHQRSLNLITSMRGRTTSALALLILITGCASAPDARPAARSAEALGTTSVKRIAAAVAGDPPVLYQKLNTNSAVRGIAALELLVNAGLAVSDDRKALHPQLADAVPTVENGL